MNIRKFSEKQLITLKWWNSPEYRHYDAVICDGAVRSGKTFAMSLGFISWASLNFNNSVFAFCGKTIVSLRRNVIEPLMKSISELGFTFCEKINRNYIDITLKNHTNRFYLFGGRDSSSDSLIQGITLSGIMLDEVALMPRSFVEQALARCSVSNARIWFNCNPDNPAHWFYREWILKSESKNALYLHFTMDDNPSLSKKVRERYERLYSGAFYERFVLGKWSSASGVIYPMFSEKNHVFSDIPECSRFVISCDYGTVNPSSFGLWGLNNGKWLRIKEYYYSSKREGMSRTDEEHYTALEQLAGSLKIDKVIVDPSASSFIECIRRHGKFAVKKADNDVISGIRLVSDILKQNKIAVHESCKDTIREFSLYCWNEKNGYDCPVKENDHAMDDLRYFVSDTFGKNCSDTFFVGSISR